MNKEIKKNNIENLEAENKTVILKLQNLHREIKAPRESFEAVMAKISSQNISQTPKPRLSPFFQKTYFKVSVSIAVLVLIVGLGTKNLLQTNQSSSDMNIFETQNSLSPTTSLFQEEGISDLVETPTEAQSKTAPSLLVPETPPENTNDESIASVARQEFERTYLETDTKYATYDETQMYNFIKYYDENF